MTTEKTPPSYLDYILLCGAALWAACTITEALFLNVIIVPISTADSMFFLSLALTVVINLRYLVCTQYAAKPALLVLCAVLGAFCSFYIGQLNRDSFACAIFAFIFMSPILLNICNVIGFILSWKNPCLFTAAMLSLIAWFCAARAVYLIGIAC